MHHLCEKQRGLIYVTVMTTLLAGIIYATSSAAFLRTFCVCGGFITGTGAFYGRWRLSSASRILPALSGEVLHQVFQVINQQKKTFCDKWLAVSKQLSGPPITSTV